MTTTQQDLETVAANAAAAADAYAAVEPSRRARALVAVADGLTEAADELVGIAMRETGLSEARLRGELKRTAVQLRLFAEVVVEGSYLDVRIDRADPAFVLGPRPDVRRYLVPVGPVLNFAASNFPFAFSVAGGDSAAALAAGAPVVVKAHGGHPELSRRTAEVVQAALAGAGMPEGVFQLIEGREAGVELLKDPRIKAGSFTGSIHAGRLLADVAASRPAPIPFYGELGSVNPVFVTRAAIEERGAALASGLVTSVSGSAGQLCTKPGFVFVPTGHALDEAIVEGTAPIAEHRLLNPAIASGYRARRDAVLSTPGITVLAEGSLRIDDEGQGWATPTFVSVSAETLEEQGSRLLDESFGPLSILVEYGDDADLGAIATRLFEGNLTATLHAGDGEASDSVRSLVQVLTEHAGRVLFGGWPTGVAVTPAMQHGGPWPATTNDSSTSVGTAAIRRFLRPVAYQDAPQALLPAPLRDDNPWNVPQAIAPAGESSEWGTL
ncbi:aldehyde dehydrogenase (NADP(+)) [Compostimonas suwonensis]|uniref:NADP-dependent aldehyde dehydrogenase n=1 Tax=Compostimonas suwonensis TaxID=1048394 RepID=A0A2M9C574_9MICO|nr:aldehyde dehydrogenase (NADP(+)) [Compostimonas suwonensis]PJJ65683.1 NADP-dependent aldehyde dehydrogenase [Compostimonas suwonensis]